MLTTMRARMRIFTVINSAFSRVFNMCMSSLQIGRLYITSIWPIRPPYVLHLESLESATISSFFCMKFVTVKIKFMRLATEGAPRKPYRGND